MKSSPSIERPEIALAWHRAALNGLDPDHPGVKIVDVAAATRLSVAAEPVINELAASMHDHPFSVMLADERACIIGARFGDDSIARHVERRGGVPGRVFTEELTGTSSIGTVIELRRPFAVHGGEHYLEALKDLSCYGAPIFHPVTGSIVGLIDVTGFARHVSPIVGPLVLRASRDIAERLLETSRSSEVELFRRYRERTARRSGPVMAMAPGFVLANTAALDVVDTADYPLLRAAIQENRDGTDVVVRLTNDRQVRVTAHATDATHHCVLLDLDAHDRPVHARLGRVRDRRPTRADPRPTERRHLVIGEPGTGRTSTARDLAGPHASRHGADTFVLDGTTWMRDVTISIGQGPTIVDDVDALPPDVAAALARLVASSEQTVVLTCGALPSAPTGHAALTAPIQSRTVLAPLRERLDDLPDLARAMTAAAGTARDLAPSALEALRAHDWPGNLHELRAVVLDASARAMSSHLTVQDLPPAYRLTLRARQLSLLERAERDTIIRALNDCGGNITRTAAWLGVSRPTLYSRVRALGIPR